MQLKQYLTSKFQRQTDRHFSLLIPKFQTHFFLIVTVPNLFQRKLNKEKYWKLKSSQGTLLNSLRSVAQLN